MKRERRLKIDFSKTRNRLSERSKEATLIVGQSVEQPVTGFENSKNDQEMKDFVPPMELSGPSRASEELKKQALNQAVQLTVKFHESRVSSDSVIINPSLVPGAKPGDVGEIELLQGSGKKLCFVFQNFENDLDDSKPSNATVGNRFVSNNNNNNNSNNNLISIESGPIPTMMELKLRSQVLVRLKSREHAEVDTVELYIKDLHLSRGDMWNISNLLLNSALYRAQKLTFLKGSIRVNVQRMYKNGHKVFSGLVGKNTKFVFRSHSARLIVFIQTSSEMWHFEESGEQMFHKLVNSLFPKSFHRWKELGTHHLITIILFSSIDLDQNTNRYSAGELPQNKKNYYRVVVDQVSILLWNEIMATLRLEFANFKRDISLQKNANVDANNPQEYILQGDILPSVKGNILEAINLAMSLVVDDFKDPDLRQTTNHFIFITPGTGIFDVSYDMLIRTSKLLSTVDSAVDIICLSKPPLHVVPLLRYLDNQNKLKYCIPTWIDISFWSDSSQAVQQWLPRCKIYDLQMMGIMETELSMVTTNDLNMTNYRSMSEGMEIYDSMAFKSPLTRQKYGQPEAMKKLPSFNEKIKSVTFTGGSSSSSSIDDQYETQKKLQPAEFLSLKTSSPTTSNAVGVTTQSKSNVSAFSALLSLSKKTESQPSTSNPFHFVKKMISTPMLRPQSSPPHSSATSILEAPLEERPIDESRHASVDTIKTSTTNRSSISTDLLKSSSQRSITTRKSASQVTKKKSKRSSRAHDNNSSFNGYWTNVDNPSRASLNEIQNMVTYGRWRFVFPPKVKRKTVKWSSLTSPASLPLTTPLFPSVQDFNQNFTFRIYDVFLNQSAENEKFTSFTLFKNMISLRLSLGFQICTGDTVIKIENQRKPNGDSKLLVRNINKSNYLGGRMYLILGNEIHRLSCDFNGLVNVQVYKRISNTDELIIMNNDKEYVEQIRSRYSEHYLPVTIKNNSSNLRTYNWNQLDQAVAGYEDSVEKHRYHRLKFVILPTDVPENSYSLTNESLTPEEIRLEGIRSLIMNINKIRFKTSAEKKVNKKVEITPEINFYTGGLFKYLKYAYHTFTTEQKLNSILFVTPKYNKNITLFKLAAILQSENGVEIIDRTWHMKLHQNCLLGMELVSWLIENFEDIDTREEAVEYGNQLMSQNLFSHTVSKHNFLDGHYFYYLNRKYLSSSPNVQHALKQLQEEIDESNSIQRKLSVASGKTDVETVKTEESESIRTRSTSNVPSFKLFKSGKPAHEEGSSRKNSSSVKAKNTSSNINSTCDEDVKTVVLSRETLCDLDPDETSWQSELIKVHYDIVHNPDHCFHIRLEWLSTTSKLIEDVVNSWAKHCDRYGLSLVEIPWEELFTLPIRNPLHSTVEISLALNPWDDEEFSQYQEILREEKYFFHLFILEQSGFMLDNRTANYFKDHSFDVTYSWGKPMFKYAQFIHATGAYIAELRENGDFFLAPNNSHISRLNLNIEQTNYKLKNKGAVYFDSQSVMLEFRDICSDENKLRAIFRRAIEEYLEIDSGIIESELLMDEDIIEEIV